MQPKPDFKVSWIMHNIGPTVHFVVSGLAFILVKANPCQSKSQMNIISQCCGSDSDLPSHRHVYVLLGHS